MFCMDFAAFPEELEVERVLALRKLGFLCEPAKRFGEDVEHGLLILRPSECRKNSWARHLLSPVHRLCLTEPDGNDHRSLSVITRRRAGPEAVLVPLDKGDLGI